jgi:hypothetical protein
MLINCSSPPARSGREACGCRQALVPPVQAFNAGRLQLDDMWCTSPASYPLGFRQGFTWDQGGGLNRFSAPLYLLVLGLGTYPVQLTARASAASPSCPFNCSGYPYACVIKRGIYGCECPKGGCVDAAWHGVCPPVAHVGSLCCGVAALPAGALCMRAKIAHACMRSVRSLRA